MADSNRRQGGSHVDENQELSDGKIMMVKTNRSRVWPVIIILPSKPITSCILHSFIAWALLPSLSESHNINLDHRFRGKVPFTYRNIDLKKENYRSTGHPP